MTNEVVGDAAIALPIHETTKDQRKTLRDRIAEGEAALARSQALLDRLAGHKPPRFP